MRKIITISRQYASGGREIGKKLAEMLGTSYYDHELLEEAAKKRGFLVSKGEYDIERMANTLLGEYHDGKLGRISLEKPE